MYSAIARASSGVTRIGGIACLTVHDDRCDQLAGLIVEHRIGSQEVGAALIAAAQIGAVAHTAMDTVESGAARDQRRITRRSHAVPETAGARSDPAAGGGPPCAAGLTTTVSVNNAAAAARIMDERIRTPLSKPQFMVAAQVHQGSTGGSRRTIGLSRSTAARSPSSTEASASSCSMLST